ncbi:hypothetical protein QR680_006757 [Steinernema hermaphroditum]|uniref:EF-hand domain-containing protein n=1 Tax=Steinernema hermaphroditum TaxID=289476 RepID=A0AA39HWH0_9BILA|nr:hypothetical protein QR680_006757 [Steinernema hermaphroditum]
MVLKARDGHGLSRISMSAKLNLTADPFRMLSLLVVLVVCLSSAVPQQRPAGAQEFAGQQAYDADHIKEHLDGKVDPTANMTPEQLQFHYFNMYDLDKNGRLDGIELIKVLTHHHEHTEQQNNPNQRPPVLTDEQLEQLVDTILKENDFNNDGEIDYGEYLLVQKLRENAAKQAQQGH